MVNDLRGSRVLYVAEDREQKSLDGFWGTLYSTYLGGSNVDGGQGIAIDSSGNAYVTGLANSTDFPTKNPLQKANAGGTDVIVAELNPVGSALIYSTYLGGSSGDYGTGIAVDSGGNAYITGVTTSTDFPTVNPLQPTYGGNDDAFVTQIASVGPRYSVCLLYDQRVSGRTCGIPTTGDRGQPKVS